MRKSLSALFFVALVQVVAAVGWLSTYDPLSGHVDLETAGVVTVYPSPADFHGAMATSTTSPATTTVTTVKPKVVRQPPRAAPRTTPIASGSAEAAIRKWFPDVYEKATRVARCESGLNPRATHTNRDGSTDHGTFQINSVHKKNFTAVTGQPFFDGVYSPDYNAQYARNLFNSSGWRPWACRGA